MITRNRTLLILTVAAVAMGTFAFATASANAAIIGHWTFDEGSGTTAADSSANGNTATEAGTAGTWITGKAGSAYSLAPAPANNNRFELADSSDLQVTGSVSVSAWVNPFAASNFGVIAGVDQTGGTGSDMYAVKTDGSDNPFWAVIGPGTDVGLTASSTLTTLGASGDGWVHLVGVYDPGTSFAGLYVNGVLDVSTGTVPTSIQSIPATPFQIGHNAGDSGFPLRAAVDDVQVYDAALSADDITFLFNNPGSALGGAVSIPEPSTFALSTLGLMSLGFVGWRRRRR